MALRTALPSLGVLAVVSLLSSSAEAVAVLTSYVRPGEKDFAPAFRRALADPAGGGVVQVPRGDFPVATTVMISGPVRIIGVGDVSHLQWVGAGTEALFSLDGSASESVQRLRLSGHGGIGIAVRATARRGPLLKDLSVEGFAQGVSVSGSFDGQIEDARFTGNATALSLTETEGWIFQAVWIDGGKMALHVERSSGLRLLGGRMAQQESRALEIAGCLGCSFDALRFEANAEDVIVGGDPKQAVRSVELVRSSGLTRLSVQNPLGCPVDGLALRDVGGPAVATLDSACPVHFSLDQADVSVVRRNSFATGGLPDVIVYEAPSALRVTSDGRAVAGVPTGAAGLTVASAPSGNALDLIHGAAAHQRQDGLPGKTDASVALRFVDEQGRPNAEIRGETESGGAGLSLLTKSGTVHVAPGGQVGIGTTTPEAQLSVSGDVHVQGVLDTRSITVPPGTSADACRVPGELRLLPMGGRARTDALRVCRADGSWQNVPLGAP